MTTNNSLNAPVPFTLAKGGTGAAITASNGGIVYSNASTFAVLAGTATAGQMLQSGASTTPAWSTSTYPATNAVSTLLYASSANVMAALSTANSAVLVTNSTGVPAWSGTMTNGQLIIGNTSGTPTAATITAGTGITVTNGAGTISIAASGGGGLPPVASTTITGRVTTTSLTLVDLTGFSVSITPSSSSSKVMIWGHICCSCVNTSGPYFTLLRNSTPICVSTAGSGAQFNNTVVLTTPGPDGMNSIAFCYLDSPATSTISVMET